MATSILSFTKLPVSAYRAPLCALCVLAGTLFLALHPSSHGPACLMRALTGIPCPGCGMTRSLTSIWHGHFLISFRYHPLGMLLFVICVCCLLLCASDHVFPRLNRYTDRVRTQFMKNATLVTIAVTMVTVWAVRLVLWKTGPPFFTW